MKQRQLGPITQIVATAVTIAVLVAYGLTLKWSVSTGHWWWVFPLGILLSIWLYFLVTDRAERKQGNAEMMDNFRRWGRAIGLSRRQ